MILWLGRYLVASLRAARDVAKDAAARVHSTTSTPRAAIARWLRRLPAAHPTSLLLVGGDLQDTPTRSPMDNAGTSYPREVGSLVTACEDLGLRDLIRAHDPTGQLISHFTYAGTGRRIDGMYGTASLAATVVFGGIDHTHMHAHCVSDHAPVVAQLDIAHTVPDDRQPYPEECVHDATGARPTHDYGPVLSLRLDPDTGKFLPLGDRYNLNPLSAAPLISHLQGAARSGKYKRLLAAFI